jgi:hypothetical protein
LSAEAAICQEPKVKIVDLLADRSRSEWDGAAVPYRIGLVIAESAPESRHRGIDPMPAITEALDCFRF